MKGYFFILCLICLCAFTNVFGQQIPLLEKRVSMQVANQRVANFLDDLSKEAGLVFSYSSSAIDVEQSFSGNFQQQSVREILEEVFQGSVQYKEKGIYVILTPAPVSKKEVTVSGYVVDENTGERIRNATVYDPITLQSSVTDEYGFFEIQVKNHNQEDFKLIVNKASYSDTMLVSSNKNQFFQNIFLKLDPKKILTAVDSPEKWKFWKLNKDKEPAQNITNLRDTIHRNFQVSFVPFVGTNRKLSGNVINDYSLNILGGYSAGTEKAEIGGLFNMNRGDVGKFQGAGIFNFTGGDLKGFQVSGILNMNLGNAEGVQGSGLVNFNLGDVKGAQVSGFVNAVGGDLTGLQVSPIANYTHRKMEGLQASVIFNGAKEVKGTQVGLFNYADTVQGASIGLISFVRKGYHKVELGTDEMLPINFSFRTGTRAFYNILSVGIRPEETDSVTWAFGYGIGTSPRLGKKTYLNIELSSQQINKGFVNALNVVSRAYIGFDYQISKNFGVYAGPTLNWRLYDNSYDFHPDLFTYIDPKIFSEHEFAANDWADQFWFGGRLGIRFF
jgi:hypothetical protein